MFDSHIDQLIVGTAVVLWFAHGTYLNIKLERVHEKLDLVLEQFNGLRRYLYEIDPQFDDERESDARFGESMAEPGTDLFAGMDDMELIRRKKSEGRRTLNTRFDE
jgi:hypothetical protein